jgi:hypothetical protein
LFSFLSKEKEKETKRKVLVYQPFAKVDEVDQNDVNQKVRETMVFFLFAKIFEPRLERGSKIFPKQVKVFQ